jgi:hypothetical protein
MSKISSVNNSPNTGAEAIYAFKTTLKSAGWTVPRSSDGSTYNSSGDQITSAGTGAGGMENNWAWFVIESPNGEHQWCFQKDQNDNAEWRVKISSLDGFTGGSPDATQTPSATDEQIILGSGTDASPTCADLFPTDTNYKFHVIAQNAAVGTGVPMYGFWAFATSNSGLPVSLIFQEPTDPDTFPELSSGTRASPVTGDPDPCLYVCQYNAAGQQFTITYWQSLFTLRMWYRMNYGDEAWHYCDCPYYYGAYIGAPHIGTDGYGSNIYNSSDDGLPIMFGREVTDGDAGLKGFSKFLKMRTINRDYPNTINLATDAMVYAGHILIPWEDNTEPVI